MLIETIFLTEMMIAGLTALEKYERMKLVKRWAKGEMDMTELILLKRQPWFKQRFKKVHVPTEKKTN
jgi:hypothetical protein